MQTTQFQFLLKCNFSLKKLFLKLQLTVLKCQLHSWNFGQVQIKFWGVITNALKRLMSSQICDYRPLIHCKYWWQLNQLAPYVMNWCQIFILECQQRLVKNNNAWGYVLTWTGLLKRGVLQNVSEIFPNTKTVLVQFHVSCDVGITYHLSWDMCNFQKNATFPEWQKGLHLNIKRQVNYFIFQIHVCIYSYTGAVGEQI